MGITHGDFWNMTIQEILNAHKGYLERTYNDWRRARFLAAAVYNAPRGKKDKVIEPTDLLTLPGDDDAPDYADDIKMLKEKRNGGK